MNKEDLIYDIVKDIKTEVRDIRSTLDRHITSTTTQGKLAVKKWTIIAGIVTTVCGAAGGIIVTIFK